MHIKVNMKRYQQLIKVYTHRQTHTCTHMHTHTYIALQTLGGVSLWGEAVVLVGALRTPGLASHTQNGDGSWTAVCFSISSLTV